MRNYLGCRVVLIGDLNQVRDNVLKRRIATLTRKLF